METKNIKSTVMYEKLLNSDKNVDIVIGLGGTGKTVINAFANSLHEIYLNEEGKRESSISMKDILNKRNIELFTIDCNEDTSLKKNELLPNHTNFLQSIDIEQITLDMPSVDIDKTLVELIQSDNIKDKRTKEKLREWLKESYNELIKIGARSGMGKIPYYSKMRMYYMRDMIKERIYSILDNNFTTRDKKEITIYIVSSTCGGTGRGIFLYSAKLIREFIEQYKTKHPDKENLISFIRVFGIFIDAGIVNLKDTIPEKDKTYNSNLSASFYHEMEHEKMKCEKQSKDWYFDFQIICNYNKANTTFKGYLSLINKFLLSNIILEVKNKTKTSFINEITKSTTVGKTYYSKTLRKNQRNKTLRIPQDYFSINAFSGYLPNDLLEKYAKYSIKKGIYGNFLYDKKISTDIDKISRMDLDEKEFLIDDKTVRKITEKIIENLKDNYKIDENITTEDDINLNKYIYLFINNLLNDSKLITQFDCLYSIFLEEIDEKSKSDSNFIKIIDKTLNSYKINDNFVFDRKEFNGILHKNIENIKRMQNGITEMYMTYEKIKSIIKVKKLTISKNIVMIKDEMKKLNKNLSKESWKNDIISSENNIFAKIGINLAKKLGFKDIDDEDVENYKNWIKDKCEDIIGQIIEQHYLTRYLDQLEKIIENEIDDNKISSVFTKIEDIDNKIEQCIKRFQSLTDNDFNMMDMDYTNDYEKYAENYNKELLKEIINQKSMDENVVRIFDCLKNNKIVVNDGNEKRIFDCEFNDWMDKNVKIVDFIEKIDLAIDEMMEYKVIEFDIGKSNQTYMNKSPDIETNLYRTLRSYINNKSAYSITTGETSYTSNDFIFKNIDITKDLISKSCDSYDIINNNLRMGFMYYSIISGFGFVKLSSYIDVYSKLYNAMRIELAEDNKFHKENKKYLILYSSFEPLLEEDGRNLLEALSNPEGWN